MDENGDAGGNYTVLGSKAIKSSNNTRFGLFPIGTFVTRSRENGQKIPVRKYVHKSNVQNHFAVNNFDAVISRTT